MDSGGRRKKADERRFRRDGSRRKDDPEPRYDHWSRCARLPANILAVLLLDVDPEDTLGLWLAECWVNDFEILDRTRPEPEWTLKLLLQARDIRQYFESEYRVYTIFQNRDHIDPKVWFEWARDLGLRIPAPFEALIDKPSRSQLEQQCTDLQKQVVELTVAARNASSSGWEGFDESSDTYPLELDVALQAWRAVSRNCDPARPVKEQIRNWIKENYPEIRSDEALERIAIVGNWKKSGGKPPGM